MPSARKPDQTAPRPASPTGVTDGQVSDPHPRAQSGAYLTTAEGLRLPDTDHSLKAGARGPTLLEDFHLREKKITVSPALVQLLAEPGPIEGREIGIIADAGSDLAGTAKLVKATAALGVKPLVVAPVGGVLKSGRRNVTVDRTLATTRSIEFDALVVSSGTTPTADIKLVVLLQEAFRHCKAVAAWGDGAAVLKAARIPKGPGIVVADDVDKVFVANLASALGLHRAWDRAPKVMASAVPPAI
jgi:catalase